MVDPTSTAEKLASKNPAARAEGQRELSQQSSSQQAATVSKAKDIAARPGVTGVTDPGTVERETRITQAKTAATEEARKLTGEETAGEIVKAARPIAQKYGVREQEVIRYLSEVTEEKREYEEPKVTPAYPKESPLFEDPYAKIMREAKFTPAYPVTKGPPPAVWGVAKIPKGEYITEPEQLELLRRREMIRRAEPTKWETTPLGFLPREIQLKLSLAEQFEKVRKWWVKVGEKAEKIEATKIPVAAVEFGKELTYGIPMAVAHPRERLYEPAKYMVTKPREAAYALGEELAIAPEKVVGRAAAWYAVGYVPKALRITKEAAVTRVYEPAKVRYRGIKYTGKITKPTLEVKAPTYLWEKHFPRYEELEYFGLRGRFEPPELAVIGRRAKEFQLQLWPKKYEPLKPTVTVEKPTFALERKIKLHPRPLYPVYMKYPGLTEAEVRILMAKEFKITPTKPTTLIGREWERGLIIEPKLLPPEIKFPAKPTPTLLRMLREKKAIRDPFAKLVSEKKPMFDPFKGIAEAYKPKKEFILEEELLVTGVTPTTAKITPMVIPSIITETMAGLSAKQLQIQTQQQIQIQKQQQQQIQLLKQLQIQPGLQIQIQTQQQIQKQQQQQIQQQRQIQKQIQQPILKLEVPTPPPPQIPKIPREPPPKEFKPPELPPPTTRFPIFPISPKLKRKVPFKKITPPVFKQPTAYAPMLHAVVGQIKAEPFLKKALKKKKKKLKFLPTGLEYRGI